MYFIIKGYYMVRKNIDEINGLFFGPPYFTFENGRFQKHN